MGQKGLPLLTRTMSPGMVLSWWMRFHCIEIQWIQTKWGDSLENCNFRTHCHLMSLEGSRSGFHDVQICIPWCILYVEFLFSKSIKYFYTTLCKDVNCLAKGNFKPRKTTKSFIWKDFEKNRALHFIKVSLCKESCEQVCLNYLTFIALEVENSGIT